MRARSTHRTAPALVALVAATGLVMATAAPAGAQPVGGGPVRVPDSVRSLGLDPDRVLAPALRTAKGTVTVSVQMSEQPIAATVTDGAVASGSLPSRGTQRSRTSAVTGQQDRVIGQAEKLGASVVGRVAKAANVVAMRVPAKNLDRLARLAGVLSVKPVARYELHSDPGGSGSLAQARQYLGATRAGAKAYDGSGVKVAVLDSGADYTHANLGGPGTEAAYEECYHGSSGHAYDQPATGTCATLFGPAAPKIKGGYDFVGETWPTTAEKPDANPIDFEGHGTHVSDIVGGRSADGTHLGIAPGADLYSVRVCSAIATSCSGTAILEGIDWALDPNGDGDLSDAMDVVNLSLGSAYGQAEDDATVAINNLVRAGVVAVVSAGNSADRPFIVGSPSSAARAISVAQTALPDDQLSTIVVDSPVVAGLPDNTVRYVKAQSWAPVQAKPITARLAQPSGNREGCTADTFAGFPAGAVALVKRGTCAASLKAQNAQAAGASAVVIWNNVPGDPPDFSFGGGDPVTIPVSTISQSDGALLSDAVAAGPVTVTLDPTKVTALRNTTVATSSRGLTVSGKRSKPDIGAPGAWLSAEVGTGSGQTSFGGTSGAAPVISGAAALVLDRYPNIKPSVVKARLLNAANTGNRTPDSQGKLYPTPVSRVGAGEVRIAPALTDRGVLSARLPGQGNVGLGLPHLDKTTTYPVELRLKNTGSTRVTYLISPEFRDRADKASGAVTVRAPQSVRVQAHSTKSFTVDVTIRPTKLPRWPFTHAAGYTGSGSDLNAPEFDGFLKAISAKETLHLGWTVLPHRSADVSAQDVTLRNGHGRLALSNASKALDGRVNVFGLTGTSGTLPKPAAGGAGSAGSNVALVDLLAAGVRDDVGDDTISFAVAGQRRQTIPLYPAGYEVDVDTDLDGSVDYAVFQSEAGGFGTTGLSVVNVVDVAADTTTPYFYTDADFDSSTQVLSAPLSALGLSRGSTFGFSVLAFDNYFSGQVTDVIAGQTWTVGRQKYALSSGADELVVPAGRTSRFAVQTDASTPSTSTGLLLLFDDALKQDAQAVQLTGGTAPAPTVAGGR